MTNIKTFDLNLLRVFDALAQNRSVTRAAERLGLSQPAVSAMLTRLRADLGDPLFIRQQRGILPTPRAEALAPQVRALLAQTEALLTPQVFDPAQAALTLRIAATDYAQRAVLLPFLAQMRQQAPHLRLSARPITADFGRDLTEGRLDMALVTPEMAPDTLRARKLFHEDYVVILRAGHRYARGLTLKQFCGLDHAIMSHDGSAFAGPTDTALARLGRSRRVLASVPNFTILIDLIRQSDMAALVPRRLVAQEPSLATLPPPLPIEGFTKILVWAERLHHDPAQLWLRERLAALA